MHHLAAIGILAMALCLPAAGALAQEAYAVQTTELRAGPGPEYPVVAVLPPGAQLWVQGCVRDYSWCDVVAGAERGWVYAGSIQSFYDQQTGYVPLLYYAASIGVVTYPFFINDYWDHHYHGRPWYRHLHRWAHHRPSWGHPHPVPHSPATGDGGRRPTPRQPLPVAGIPQRPPPTGGMPRPPISTSAAPRPSHSAGVMPPPPRWPHGASQPAPPSPSWTPRPSREPGVSRPGFTTDMAAGAGRPAATPVPANRVTRPPHSPGARQESQGWHGGYRGR